MNAGGKTGAERTWPSTCRAEPFAVPGKGRGVRAIVSLSLGDVIMRDCTILLSAADCVTLLPTAIEDYYFAHPEDPTRGLMVLGLASLCNHSDAPSAQTIIERDAALGWVVTLTATRSIPPNGEITRRYACQPWFEVAE